MGKLLRAINQLQKKNSCVNCMTNCRENFFPDTIECVLAVNLAIPSVPSDMMQGCKNVPEK